MGLDLAHGRDVPLRNLVVIFHIVLKSLIVVILNLFACNAANFRILIRLIVRFGHGDLVLRVERQLRVRALKFSHKWRGKRRFTLGRLRHGRKVLLVALMGAPLGSAVRTAAHKCPRVHILGQVELAAEWVLW